MSTTAVWYPKDTGPMAEQNPAYMFICNTRPRARVLFIQVQTIRK